MSDPSKPGKIEDVARRAGVSIMSVSRAIRGVDGVSHETRARILMIARQMKYMPNSAARSLAMANSNLIGIALPDYGDPVFTHILKGLQQTFGAAGYATVINTPEHDSTAELHWVRRLMSWQPAAIVLTGTDHHPETRSLLKASAIPVLELWDQTQEPIDICVGIDHAIAGRLVGEHAVALGYQRPAFVSTPRGYSKQADARLDGVREVFSLQRSTPVIVATPTVGDSTVMGFEGTRSLLAEHAPDIICYLDDYMAFGGFMCCQAQGLSVPQDIGLVGFHAMDVTSVLPIKLTTVRTPHHLAGATGACNLLSRIKGLSCTQTEILPLDLLPGHSTRPQTDNDRLREKPRLSANAAP